MTNTARYWTYLTSIICGKPIDDDIPDNEFFLSYGPSYELNILASHIQDRNTEMEFELNFQRIQGMNVLFNLLT